MDRGFEFEPISNNEACKAWSAFILGRLYSQWPGRTSLLWLDAKRATGIDVGDHVEEGYGNERLFTELVMWLQREGFITFEEGYRGGATGACLTLKCMALLECRPDGMTNTIGQMLEKAAAYADEEEGRTLISKLIALVFGAAWESWC